MPASRAIVTIYRSKTDEEGERQKLSIPSGRRPPTRPVRARTAWPDQFDAEHGPIFRCVDRPHRSRPTRLSDQDVARVVKRAAPASTPCAAAVAARGRVEGERRPPPSKAAQPCSAVAAVGSLLGLQRER